MRYVLRILVNLMWPSNLILLSLLNLFWEIQENKILRSWSSKYTVYLLNKGKDILLLSKILEDTQYF